MKFLIFHRYARRAPSRPTTQSEWHGVRWAEILPSLTLLFMMIAMQVPFGLIKHTHVAPAFLLMGVAFWSIYMPQSLSLWFLFFLGFVNDLITGEIMLGFTAFILIGTHALLVTQNHFVRAQSFIVLWIGFVALVSVIALLQALLSLLLLPAGLNFSSFILTILVNGALYPLLAGLLSLLLRMLQPQSARTI